MCLQICVDMQGFYRQKGATLEIILPLLDLGLSYELALSHQLHSAVTCGPTPAILLKSSFALCLIYFLENSLVAVAMYVYCANSKQE